MGWVAFFLQPAVLCFLLNDQPLPLPPTYSRLLGRSSRPEEGF
jgi:hypothetical protein